MPPEQRENLRIAILAILNANASRYGLSAQAIRLQLPRYGFASTPIADVECELEYLIDKTFAESPAKAISPENRLYRITASGRDFLAQNE